MALGKDRPRNYGAGQQQACLNIVCLERKVATKVVTHKHGVIDLLAAPSNGKITLSFSTIATLEHPCRGLWRALHPFTGEELASAPTQRECIRRTLLIVWR